MIGACTKIDWISDIKIGFVSAPSRVNVGVNADSSGTLIIKSGALAASRIDKPLLAWTERAGRIRTPM